MVCIYACNGPDFAGWLQQLPGQKLMVNWSVASVRFIVQTCRASFQEADT
jgi:hypothetical protein